MSPDLLPEDRLREALRTEAAAVEPSDDTSLDTIRRRGRAAIARRRAVVGGLSAIVLAGGAFLAVSLLGDDDQTVIVEPGPDESTSTTSPEPTTTPTAPVTTTPAPPVTELPYLWPPPGHDQYTDPVGAARSFVVEYVGFPEPRFGEVREAEPRLVEIDVLALGESGEPIGGQHWSTLQLRQVEGDVWRVSLATSDQVVIEGVESSDSVVTVRGIGNGFEGTLNAHAVDADGGRLGDPAIITVNCCEALEPFEATIAVPERPASVLVISSTGLEVGSDFAATPVANAGVAVSVFFVGGDGTVQPVVRYVEPPAVLNGALAALLAGPAAGEGVTTGLPAGLTATAAISGDQATVDLAGPEGQALPPGQAERVVEQLSRTVFQFPNIEAVRFGLNGSCEDFGAWTGLRECRYDR
jgi:hypothetical protein